MCSTCTSAFITWKRSFTRSTGAVDIRDSAPAAAPAMILSKAFGVRKKLNASEIVETQTSFVFPSESSFVFVLVIPNFQATRARPPHLGLHAVPAAFKTSGGGDIRRRRVVRGRYR